MQHRKNLRARQFGTLTALIVGLSPIYADTPAPLTATPALLTLGKPIVVPGGPGHFDWMLVDAPRHRLLAAHPGTKTLTIYDLRAGTVKSLDTGGEVNGEAIDEADGKLFVAGPNQKVLVFDLKTLTKTGEVALTGPADALEFNPKNGTLYVDHDDGTEVWTIRGKDNALTGAVTVAGAPEFLAYEPTTDRLYQNIKPANCVQVINPATNKVEATWPTAPMTSPHGLAVDAAHHRLFSAGSGQVVVLDLKTGKMLTHLDIAPGYVDQIAFDAPKQRLYCATSVKTNPDSQISVIDTSGSVPRRLGIVSVPKGTHTLAVDPETHDVWISHADDKNSYLQPLALP